MNVIESIPFELRIAILFVVGAFLGSLANWATYRLAWNQRRIGPWTAPEPGAPPRKLVDWIPIFGWVGLQRESSIHGPTFWIRPMLVELATGFGLAWFYWWEIYQLGLLPAGTPRLVPIEWLGMLHVQFVIHVILLWLMLVATLIDTDEKTIPDTITLPGTLLALLAAALLPYSLLPDMLLSEGDQISRNFWPILTEMGWPFLTFASPLKMPEAFQAGGAAALIVGLGCWWLWCVGLMRRDWYTRHGLRRAMVILCARLKRTWSTYGLLLLGLIGTAGIVWVWLGPPLSVSWVGLITALVGMAAAGGLVWVIRLIGAAMLKREAMGFGDVTLMAMIGAFLGWQTSLLVFFFAVIIAALVGLAMWFLQRENEIPFGPFLCIGATIVLVFWADLWNWAGERFTLGIWVPIIIIVCLALMAILLGILQLLKRLF